MGESTENLLGGLSDEQVAHSRVRLYLVIAMLAVSVLVPLTAFVLTRPVRLKPQAAPTARLVLSPSEGSFGVGEVFRVVVILDTQGNLTNGVDVVAYYDSSRLRLVGVQPGEVYRTYAGVKNDICGGRNGLQGKVSFSGFSYNPQVSFNGVGEVGVITFKAITPGEAGVKLYFDVGSTVDSNVAGAREGRDVLSNVAGATYLVKRAANPRSVPIPTPPVCPSVSATPTPVLSQPQREQSTRVKGAQKTDCSGSIFDGDCDSRVCESDFVAFKRAWEEDRVTLRDFSLLMNYWSNERCDER